jgi:hypothetical protein
MRPGSQQVLTVFGGAYVAEQHAAEAERTVSLPQDGASGIAWIWLAFYAVIALAAVARHTGSLI